MNRWKVITKDKKKKRKAFKTGRKSEDGLQREFGLPGEGERR